MPSKLAPTVLAALALAVTAGCGTMSEGTLIDFGPEPGTPGDPAHWHFQPQLHGPNAPPRDETRPAERVTIETAPAAGSVPAAPATPAAVPELPPPPAPPVAPVSPVSETMFNDAIRRAVAGGDIDRALRLLEEAERLGSTTARTTFIEALESR